MLDPQRGQRFFSPKGKFVLTILPHQSQNFVNLNQPKITAASTGTTTSNKTLSGMANDKYPIEKMAKTIAHH